MTAPSSRDRNKPATETGVQGPLPATEPLVIEDVRRVLVVGAGTMGRQIALQCAFAGYFVMLTDTDPRQLAASRHAIEQYGQDLEASGRIAAMAARGALERIRTLGDPSEAAAEADILIESIPENPALKRQVFRRFGKLCRAQTVFTTNTSTLLPSKLAAATGRPDRFAALHFHAVVWESQTVDVMPHAGTAPEVTALLEAFAQRLGQRVISYRREHAGYLFNNMLGGLLFAAINLAATGVATPEEIDRAYMAVTKHPIGPFGVLDLTGIDVTYGIMARQRLKRLFFPPFRTNFNFLKAYVERGWLGVKTGRGFYDYPDPAFRQPDFLDRGPSPQT